MGEPKHSRGPWSVHSSLAGSVETLEVTAPDGSYVAEVTNTETPADEQDWANAKLISAAPDLLAALKKMRATMYSDKSEESVMADAAIAKAEGK